MIKKYIKKIEEEKIEELPESVVEALLILDWKGKIIFANDALAKLAEYKSKKDMIGKNCLSFVHPDHRKEVLKDIFLIQRTHGPYFREYKLMDKDENTKWGESIIEKVEFKGKKKLLARIRDITEKKEQEKKYELIAKNSSDVIHVLDLKKNKYTFVSPSVKQVFGYTPKEAVNLNPQEILTPESFEIQLSDMKRTLKKGGKALKESKILELEAIKKDGTTFWIETNAKFLFDEQNQPYAIIGVSRDINESKKTKKKLKESEEKFRLIAENTGDLISVATFSLIPKYTYIAPSIKNILYYEPEELIGKNGLPYIHPVDRKKFIVLLKKYLKYKAIGKLNKKNKNKFEEHLECRFKDKKGNWHYLETTINLIENEKILLVSKDVTKKKKEERVLRKERDKILALFNNVEDVIYVVDMDTYEILFVNKFTEKTFGKKLVGKTCYKELQGLNKPCSFCTNKKIKELKGKPYHWEYFNPIVKRNHNITDRMIDWPDGRKVRFEIAHDITEQKKTEKIIEVQRDLATALIQIDDLKEVGKTLFKKLKSLEEMDSGGLYLKTDNALKLIYSFNLSPNFVKEIAIYKKNSPQYHLIEKGKEYFTEYQKLPIQKSSTKKAEKIKSIAIIPLKDKEDILGCLHIASHKHAKLSEITKNAIRTIAYQAQQIALRIKRENELKESEKRHRIVTEKTGNLIYDYDVVSGKIKWFGAIKEVTGYTPEEFNNIDIKKWAELIHPDDRDFALNELEKTKEKIDKYNIEYRMRQKNKKYIYVEEHGVFISNGEKKSIRMFGAIKNISEKKIFENKIKESEKKYRLLSESSAEGIVMLDSKGKIKYANPSFEDLSGYSLKELLKSSYKKLFSPSSLKKAEKRFKKMMSGQVWTTKNNEYRLKKKDGEIIDIEISSSVIKKDGKIEGLMSVIRNVEMKKKYEKNLKEKIAELEQINKLMIGRELKMVELKEKNEKLENELSALKYGKKT